jgi:hypothetical protein
MPAASQATHVAVVCGAGYGTDGQLGNGGTASQTSPVAVSGSYNFTLLTAGNAHTCGLLGNGSALCWGENKLLACRPVVEGRVCVPSCRPAFRQNMGINARHLSATRCLQAAWQCMCGRRVVQVMLSMGNLAMAALWTKQPQRLCLAHTASHC